MASVVKQTKQNAKPNNDRKGKTQDHDSNDDEKTEGKRTVKIFPETPEDYN